MADQFISSESLEKVADAINQKAGRNMPIVFPDQFISKIENLVPGGESGPSVDELMVQSQLTEYTNDTITNMSNAVFMYSPNLVRISLPNVETIPYGMFMGCGRNLIDVNMPKVKVFPNNVFLACNKLPKFVMPVVERIGKGTFIQCNKLEKVIIGSSVVPVLGGELFHNANPGPTNFYVPDNLVDQYKVATRWVNYANIIHPMSDLPPEERI